MNTTYAGFGKRFVASMIDGMILTIPMMLLGVVLGLGSEAMGLDPISMVAISYLFSFVLSMLYFAYFESSEKQATPGKGVMKIKVTDTNGNRLSFGKALVRNLMKIISGLILYIGFIMAAFTQKKQALHDMAASAILIDASPQRELNTTL